MLRSHTCGELREKNIGTEVNLCGWVNKSRTHGGVLFIDIRDRYGVTQLVFNPTNKFFSDASSLNKEDVIKASGKVKQRPNINKEIPTGNIEIDAEELIILNKCKSVLPLDENIVYKVYAAMKTFLFTFLPIGLYVPRLKN